MAAAEDSAAAISGIIWGDGAWALIEEAKAECYALRAAAAVSAAASADAVAALPAEQLEPETKGARQRRAPGAALRDALAFIAEKGGTSEPDPSKPGNRIVTCGNGHTWSTQVHNLASGHWCAHCYGNAPLTIEQMREIAEARGGTCESEVYGGLTRDLKWKCSEGHEWLATPNNIKNKGSWCGHCGVNTGEELVRAALSEAFPGETFDRTRRQPWMKGLELDGYSERLKLAFEYQGKQHYERVPHFQPREGAFESQLERDQLTLERCMDEPGVTLLVVPYTVGFVRIRDWVRRELISMYLEIGPKLGDNMAFYDNVRAAGRRVAEQFAKAREIIAKKKGVCLSERFISRTLPLRIRCEAGHEFEASLAAIDQPASRGPRFCPECGGTRPKTDEELNQIVSSCGFELLHVESRRGDDRRMRRHITVSCPVGPTYEVLFDNFSPLVPGVPRKGCAECSNARKGVSKRGNIREWCRTHGVHPTAEYRGQEFEHEWVCVKGHTFAATYGCLKGKKGALCIPCKVDQIASLKGLQLITPWVDKSPLATPLTWRHIQCGTEFRSSFQKLVHKKGCPSCK